MRGRSSLALAAMLAMTAGAGVIGTEFPLTRRRGDDGPLWPPKQEPDNRGRRAEKDALALAKAEAKRQRRAAKRLKDMGPNDQASGARSVPLNAPVGREEG